ncbi:uncharacterized protein LOC129710161 [Leucoraja erinacea]|uniref:uncharacterized protein LOC129710161 n=1 Tax=Leucoraja erinaceus TaxID=7782 RepID=UPI0024568509|nr:uncharacterized protein LOC129710161 [Leucoraja erinacea]
MFYSATKKIVSEIDPDGFTLFPVKSPYDSPKCKPLHLVIKKKRNMFSRRENYVPTSFRLTDILIDGKDLNFGLSSSIIACYSEASSTSLSAQVCVDAGKVNVGAHVSTSSSDAMSNVEMRKHTISECTLLDVVLDRKVDREHPFVKRMKSNMVYVILEVIETEHACSVNDSAKAATGIKWLLSKLLKTEAELRMSRERKLTFPAGTSLAYMFFDLRISPNGTLELNWAMNAQNSPTSIIGICISEKPKLRAGQQNTENIGGENDFRPVCYENERHGNRRLIQLKYDQKPSTVVFFAELTKMSADKKPLFLNVILEILGHSDSFLVLDEMLDQILDGVQPDLQVLDQTEEDNRACVEKMLDLLGIKKENPPGETLALTAESEGIIRAINTLIQSLSEMDPETLILLEISVEAEIISKQLKLVTIIDDKWSGAPQYQCDLLEVKEDPEKVLITQFTDEEFEITQHLLEEFGFQLDRESASALCIMNRKQGDVLALFAALYALNALCD